MAGNAPAPWDASSVALLGDTLVEHTFTVKVWNGNTALGTRVEVPAYDVQVTLSASRVPMGTVTFKTPLPPWDGITWPTGNLTLLGAPYRTCTVEILAGWRHLIGGVMTDDQQTVMFGYVTEVRRRIAADGSSYVQWTAVTVEQLYEYPSHRTYDPADSFTRLKQVTDAVTASGDPWYITPVLKEGTLNTPNSTQLASFRAADIAVGDTVGDYLRMLAQLLGQRVRPDWRATTVRLRVDAEPTYSAANKLTMAAAEETEEVAGVDSWGSILNMRAQWYNAGDQKTASRTFPYPGVFPVNPPTYGRAVAVPQDATIWTKPPGGAIPNDLSWPPVALWMNRINGKNALILSATSRAAWWLQPLDVITYTDPGLTLVIDTITFQLDAGAMTVTGYAP